MFYLIVLRSN